MRGLRSSFRSGAVVRTWDVIIHKRRHVIIIFHTSLRPSADLSSPHIFALSYTFWQALYIFGLYGVATLEKFAGIAISFGSVKKKYPTLHSHSYTGKNSNVDAVILAKKSFYPCALFCSGNWFKLYYRKNSFAGLSCVYTRGVCQYSCPVYLYWQSHFKYRQGLESWAVIQEIKSSHGVGLRKDRLEETLEKGQ